MSLKQVYELQDSYYINVKTRSQPAETFWSLMDTESETCVEVKGKTLHRSDIKTIWLLCFEVYMSTLYL